MSVRRTRHRLRHRVGARGARRLRRRRASSASASTRTSNGVIDERLPAPDGDVELEADWALQDPARLRRAACGAAVPRVLAETGVAPDEVVGRRHRLHVVHDAAHARRRHAALPARRPAPRAARVGEALEAPRGAAGGRPDQRGRRASAASPGSRATAARSRPSGSLRRRCRSSTRRRTSTRAPTG